MATLRIFSGGAPKEIFLQLTPQFEQKYGHKVEYVFAVMSALRDKVAAGDKADVLVMPTNILDDYQKNGVVQAQGRAILGLVSVNAVVRTGAPKPDLSTPDKVKQSILNSRDDRACHAGCDAERHAYGKTDRAIRHFDAMKGKIIHRPALEGGVQLVASGEADIGFYPKSEVINTEGFDRGRTVTAPIQLTTIYGAAVTASSTHADAGRDFIAFMTESAHRAAWTHAGFDPP